MLHPRSLLLLMTVLMLIGTSIAQRRRRKDPRPMGFWRGLVFKQHSHGTQRGPRNTKKQEEDVMSNLVLMTECPLNSQCVDRNFCDDEGFITKRKINNYSLKQDKRKFIACVDLVNMDLAVCCSSKSRVSSGTRGVRQDKPVDLFNIAESSFNKPENSLNKPGNTFNKAGVPNSDGFKIEFDSSEPTDFSDVDDILRKMFGNNDAQTDIGNENVAISVGEARDGRPLIIINVNSGIFNRPRNTEPRIVNVESADQIDTSLGDNFNPVVENFDPVVEPDNTVVFNNNNNDDTNVFVECPAATVCVAKTRCDFSGVMTNRTIKIDPRVETLRAPLNVCINSSVIKRRGRAGQSMVCCRDPNYKDPWPDMMKKKKKVHNYDMELDMFMEERRARRRRPNRRRFSNRF